MLLSRSVLLVAHDGAWHCSLLRLPRPMVQSNVCGAQELPFPLHAVVGCCICRWQLPVQDFQSQHLLLTALHCRCLQLLVVVREQLPPEVCTLAVDTSHSMDQLSPQQQQQLKEWRLCITQVQHNLLQVFRLTKQWEKHNAVAAVTSTLQETKHRCEAKRTFRVSLSSLLCHQTGSPWMFPCMHVHVYQVSLTLGCFLLSWHVIPPHPSTCWK